MFVLIRRTDDSTGLTTMLRVLSVAVAAMLGAVAFGVGGLLLALLSRTARPMSPMWRGTLAAWGGLAVVVLFVAVRG